MPSKNFYTTKQLNPFAWPGQPVQCLRVEVPCQLNDVLVGLASQEFTTQEAYPSGPNAMTWVDFFVSQDPNALVAASVPMFFASRGATNITPAQHHLPFGVNGAVTIPIAGTWYAILVVNWDEDLRLPGIINQGESYGKLDVIRHR